MKERKQKKLSTKLMLGLTVFALLNLIFISLVVGIVEYNSDKKEYSETAFSFARAASRFIDGDRVLRYLDVVGSNEKGEPVYYTDEYYDEVMSYLTATQSEYELMEYFYVFLPGENTCTYIWDADTADMYSQRGYVSDISQKAKEQEAIRLAFSRSPQEKIIVSTDGVWGNVLSAFYPIFDSSGEPVALVGADLSVEGLISTYLHFLLPIILAILAVTAATAGIVFSKIKKILVLPIEQLNEATKDLVNELDSGRHFDLEIHTGDELEELADSFRKMDNDLRDYLDRLSSATADRERIHAEFDIAKQIQADIIPNEFPAFPDRKDFDIFAALNPCEVIGGDFFDFFLIDGDHLAVVVGDVSDKGVPAALYMVMVQTLIKNRALQGFTPAEVLQSINEQMLENKMEMFSTIWLAVLELSTGKGIAANAGHQHPVLCRAGKKFEHQIYKHSPPVGAMEGIRFRDHGFQLYPGDTVFIYSDGVRDAVNAQLELFGKQGVLKALNQEPEATPSVLLHTVRSAVERFIGDAEQTDDLSMLSFRYYGPGGGTD